MVFDFLSVVLMGCGSWVCLIVNSSYCRGGSQETLESNISDVIGDDFIELRILFDENRVEDSYAFLKFRNVEENSVKLRKVNAVKTVLDSYTNPRLIAGEEVEALFKKEEASDSLPGLIYGDVVKISEGYLGGLTGIVYGRDMDDLYRVCFKFHTRSFVDILPRDMLVYESNLFDELKFPVELCKINGKDVAVIPQDRIDQNALRACRLH
jgi:hypothetical protein